MELLLSCLCSYQSTFLIIQKVPAPGDAVGLLNSGLFQVIGIVLTFLGAFVAAKFTRSSSREANQTTGWTNLVAALQKEVAELNSREDKNDERVKELDLGNKDLSRRVYVLERSRHRWKGWGQRVVEIMEGTGIKFPDPPEPLADTDPNLEKQ